MERGPITISEGCAIRNLESHQWQQLIQVNLLKRLEDEEEEKGGEGSSDGLLKVCFGQMGLKAKIHRAYAYLYRLVVFSPPRPHPVYISNYSDEINLHLKDKLIREGTRLILMFWCYKWRILCEGQEVSAAYPGPIKGHYAFFYAHKEQVLYVKTALETHKSWGHWDH